VQAVTLLRMSEDKHNILKFVACRVGFKCREHFFFNELFRYADILGLFIMYRLVLFSYYFSTIEQLL